MSQVLAKLETAKIIELKQELETTPYPKLKKKLTEIGVPDAWIMGEEKDVIIRSAMQMLEKIGSETPEEVKPEIVAEVASPEVETEVVKEVIETETIKEPVIEEKEKEVLAPVITPIVEEKAGIEAESNEDEIEETIEKEEVAKHILHPDDPRNFISAFKDASIEDLHKNVERIDMLLRDAPDFQKVILFAKKKQITDRLIELGE